MYITIEELRKLSGNVVSMPDYVETLTQDEPTIILRNYEEPTSPPCFEPEVEVFDFDKNPRPYEDVVNSYGTKPNVPASNVINAIKAALGAGGYALHISDASYTGYSIWELQQFMRNFDKTDLRVWIREVFDCDDFSQVLQGNVNSFFPGIAFGTIWYGPRKPPMWGHSVNIFYSYSNNRIYLIEPQNDTFYLFNKKLWRPWMVIM